MSYEGEILNQCPSDIDFGNTWAVVVSGASWNPCGHMIFCCGTNSADAWYFHVAGQGGKGIASEFAEQGRAGDSRAGEGLLEEGCQPEQGRAQGPARRQRR